MDTELAEAPAQAPDDDDPGPRWPGGVAGLLGAAAALVTIEVVALADATGTSVTEAVQNRFIESFAASLKDLAVDLFGTSDKVALQVGTAIVVLMIGAALGLRVRDQRNIVIAGFGAFALIGIVVAVEDPLASDVVSAAAVLLGAGVGLAVTFGLEAWWRSAARRVARANGLAELDDAVARRVVLGGAGATAAVLLLGTALARSARQSLRDAATVVSRVLPRPVRTVPVPAEPIDVAGISPYITPTKDFYRIDTALRVPIINPDQWAVTITGMVDRELKLTYDQLLARDLVEIPITMLCVSNEVGGDLVGTAVWTGVPLADLLREAGVQEGADQVMTESVDGFTAGFPTEVALDGRDALLVVGMDGRSLPPAHGFPARLVIPGLYGYVSATKWLKEIRLTTFAEEEGFWVPRGWSRLGPIKTSSRIDVPRRGEDVASGDAVIAGVAWAPTRGIRRVEVRVDDGPWEAADLGLVASEDTWVQWRLAWKATAGSHTIAVRATDGDGGVQTASEAPPAPDGATGHHTISVDVT